MSGRPPPAFEDAIAGQRVDLGLLRRLLGWLVPERRSLALSGLLVLVTALFQVILPVILSVVVIDHLLLGEESPAAPDLGLIALTEGLAAGTGASPLLIACALYAVRQLAIGLAGHGHRMLLIGAVVGALARLREAVFLKLLRQPAAFWDKVSVGRVTTRVTNDVEALYELLRSLGTFLGEFVPFFVALGIMLSADVPLTLTLLAFAPILGALSLAFRRAMRNVYRRARESLSWLNQQMQENLAGLTVVQLYGREQENLTRYQATNGENRRDETRALALETFYGALTDSLSNLALALTLFLGARALGAEADGLTLGTVVLFTRYIDLLFQPLAALGEQYNLLFRAMASGERIFQALDWPSLQEEPEAPAALPPRLAGALRFEQLSFAYEAGTPVLKGLTFTVPARSTVAIVGPTGSGKSTLIRLLSRLYTVDPGQLFIDDVDVTQIHSRELRRRIGVVLQDFHVFAGTVLDNITPRGPGDYPGKGGGRRGHGRRRRLYPRPTPGLRYGARGARTESVSRTAPAAGLRPGAGHGSGNPRARRSHGKHRFGNGSGNPGGAKAPTRGSDHGDHRPPPCHHRRCGPGAGLGKRNSGGPRVPGDGADGQSDLRPYAPPPVRGGGNARG